MFLKTKKMFRPALEGLETRDLMAAGLLGSLAAPMPTPPAHVGQMTQPPIAKVNYAAAPATQGSPAATAHSTGMTTSGFDGTYQDSVVTITNTSRYTVYFSLHWDNTGWGAVQTLAPGQVYWYWDQGAGHNAYVNFQKGVLGGCLGNTVTWQNTTYVLPSNTVTDGGMTGRTAQATDGQWYQFQTTYYCALDLYNMGGRY